ncbi:MAG: tRNA pseudouridine synthase B [Alphaproteobacteria bacterium MarineAlpha5_Bin8]|nr:MAG: tRNA pseudouridine synthase B [Alphaproteobacteria bacterium MarineAlpha5_Bin7]PPR48198.1 MAG: tRNA pseudouridine synthase B [Alphaproteobacteria bacterium MarineAlpha5_Bin8]|tara:strand:- start:390 stop:1292 length:903 start_codon:yes stop_codon:yes gene_type:complete
MNEQGWLNIYKPLDVSSFNVIKKIKKKFNIIKLGHAGTLDPLAEGILPIAIGKTTKLIPFVQNSIKEYEFEIKWGEETSTDDKEGEIIDISKKIPDDNEIIQALKNFECKFYQYPPKASAVKINGIRSYKLFRSNIDFETNKKEVQLFNTKLINTNSNISRIIIKCGSGFYVRSLARDLATELGTKGHIFSLKRTKVGKFSTNNSILLDDALKISQTLSEFKEIQPSISMLDDILAYEIEDEKLIKEISYGKSVEINKFNFHSDTLNLNDKKTIFLTIGKNVLSFGKFDGDLFVPKKVLI